MTCIAGVVQRDGSIFMGGDSAATFGTSGLVLRADQKVFRNGDMLIGFSGSFRAGQILRYAFTPPKHSRRVDVHRYMVTDFVDAARDALKRSGVAVKEHDAEGVGAGFIVGYCGRLFEIEGDYDVGEAVDGFVAIGCGRDTAAGALYVTDGMPPRPRIRAALEAAERYSSGVRRPFYVQKLEPTT